MCIGSVCRRHNDGRHGIARGHVVETLELYADFAMVDDIRRRMIELVTRQRQL